MTSRFVCARHAQQVGEPVFGTASPIRRWLLLEQDGAWGRDAVLESRIESDVALALKARAAKLGARLLLIRRYGRTGLSRHRVFVAATEQQDGFVERFEVRAPAAVLDLDLAPLGNGRPSGGEVVGHPLFLVCTNGRHDACCAEFGRPLAQSLGTTHPEATWECSHVGGDRFAGNVVCLPEGVYYGRVGPLEASAIADAHLAGLIDLDHYRGRSCLPFVAQAAEYFLRRAHDLQRLDDLVAERREQVDEHLHRVTFAARGGRRYVVEVTAAPDPHARPLTCSAQRPQCPPAYALRSVEEDAAGLRRR